MLKNHWKQDILDWQLALSESDHVEMSQLKEAVFISIDFLVQIPLSKRLSGCD